MVDRISTACLTPEDADEMLILLQSISDEMVRIEWLYTSTELKATMTSSQYIFVGVKVNAKLVSTLVFYFPEPSGTIVEMTNLVVHPEYRYYRYGEVIRRLVGYSRELINQRAKHGTVCALYSKLVTRHLMSQKLQRNMGMLSSGIIYCTRPDESSLKRITDSREANYHTLNIFRRDMVVAIYCYTSKLGCLRLCLPDEEFSILSKLLSDGHVSIKNVDHLPVAKEFIPKLKFEPFRSVVEIHFSQGACDFENFLRKFELLCQIGYRVIHVFLNVGEFDNLNFIEMLRDQGFIYSYFLPCCYDLKGHAFVMQYLNSVKSSSKSSHFLDKKIQKLHKQLSTAKVKQ